MNHASFVVVADCELSSWLQFGLGQGVSWSWVMVMSWRCRTNVASLDTQNFGCGSGVITYGGRHVLNTWRGGQLMERFNQSMDPELGLLVPNKE